MDVAAGLASLDRRAKFARGSLLAYMIAVAAAFPVGLGLAYAVYSLEMPLQYLGVAYIVLAAIGLLLFIAMAITIPGWTYRAWANLHAMRVEGLRFSPLWASGSFFVPIIGLFVPFVAMRQLANRSYGEEEYHSNASVPDVTSWWACYIGGNFIQFFTLSVDLFNTNGLILIVAHPIVRLLTTLFGVVLLVGAAWFLFRVIRDVTAAQKSFTGISETFA